MTDEKASFKVLSPKLPKEFEVFDFININIQNEDLFSVGAVYDCSIENQIAERVTFQQSIFKNVTFNHVSLKFLDLTDVRFENCDLSNMDLSGAVIHRVEFIKCKIVGVNLTDSTLRNVVFEDCNGRYACFRASNLGQVSIKNCLLRNSDFAESSFSKVSIDYSDLQQAQMSGMKPQGIDFSNCDIEGLGARIDDLCGAIVSPAQAVSLSRKMGLVIKE